MIGVRRKSLHKTLGGATDRAVAALSRYAEGGGVGAIPALLDGAYSAASLAIEGLPSLDRLWGLKGDDKKASNVLEVFAIHLLARANWRESPKEAFMSARTLFMVFGDAPEAATRHFMQRHQQVELDKTNALRLGHAIREARPEVSLYLLWSDAHLAMGAPGYYNTLPTSGFPFADEQTFMAHVAAGSRLRSVDAALLFKLRESLASGLEVASGIRRQA